MSDVRPTSDQLKGFLDDLERGLKLEIEPIENISQVLLCGMGGSAISGDIVADCCCVQSSLPIRVLKSPCVPNWVDSSVLAIVSSYSGNTIETIRMYDQVRSKGCNVKAITSGGILKKKTDEDGVQSILLPSDMHPRHSIGLMIGYTLSMLKAAGGPDLGSSISSFIPSLESYRESMEGPNSIAERLAAQFIDHVPLICSDASMKSVVLRWKTQINENSKYVAFCGTLPEYHDCIMTVAKCYEDEGILPTILSGCDDPLCNGTSSIDCLAADLYRMNVPFEYVKLDGASTLENLFRAIILGDYISMYMADLRGIDSAEVKPIRQLKAKIKELSDNTEGAS